MKRLLYTAGHPKRPTLVLPRQQQTCNQRLVQHDALVPCTQALKEHGFFPPELPSGSPVFVHPYQFVALAEAPQVMALKHWHVVFDKEFEASVIKAIGSLPSRKKAKECGCSSEQEEEQGQEQEHDEEQKQEREQQQQQQ